MADQDTQGIARRYRAFVAETAPTSPLYARLAGEVADSGDVLSFLATLPSGKQQPNLLFAALQFLHGAPTGGAELRRIVAEDADRLRDTMLTRATQTNEPARCGALLPVLALLGGPLALVEVGASAGLCLYPDRYHYEYDGAPVGPDSPLHLTVSTSGPVPVPLDVPSVIARIGVDLNPLDPADADDRAWLRALVWPGPHAEERLRRIDDASEVARTEPARMLTGDLLDRLPDALDLVPENCTVVVMHTAVLPYLSEAARVAFVARMDDLPVRWLAQEAPGLVPGTGNLQADPRRPELVVSLDGRPLARSAPHGGWLEWLPDGLGASGE